MIYFDCETCGLHGVPVLIQWAENNGPVQLHEVWRNPIWATMDLIERFLEADAICGFNIAFDFLHICKIYTMFSLFPDKDAFPEDHIDELGVLEEKARFVDLCLKPKSALDVMLVARKTKYQSLMARAPIRIRRVPTALAWQLADELGRRIQFDDIYFANKKDKNAPKWKVFDIKRPDGEINPEFKDIKLQFHASTALKNLYRHAFKVTEKFFTYGDIEVDRAYWPKELGYAPFALALAPDYHKDGRWRETWPEVIREHILHWGFNDDARKYAGDDVVYTRRLAVEHFGNPPPGDVDSTLACMVAACRWRGYAVDKQRLLALKEKALRELGFDRHLTSAHLGIRVTKEHVKKYGKALLAPKAARVYVSQVMDETEKLIVLTTTKRVILEEIATWIADDGTKHPAAIRAQEVLDARMAQKEIELYDKILRAGRLHASFKVIGTLSSRMAGADGLNPQGIKRTKVVRRAFSLADKHHVITFQVLDQKLVIEVPDFSLCGGDFKSFEVSLAATVFNDPDLTKALMTGKKVHALMGMVLFPGNSYDDICASEGTDNDMYTKGKVGFFLKCYFGEAYTFNQKLGIPMEIAEKANEDFNRQFPNVGKFQGWVKIQFGALSQPNGLGTKVEWKEPADFAESFLGFKRYFTLENRVMRTLFDLAQKTPEAWKSVKVKVLRRERVQTAGGAVSSALYGAAFAIMGSNIRAAGNHYIQSPGADICKATQANVWTVQPCGIHPWIVIPMNIHDELMCPTRLGYEDQVEAKAKETVAHYKKQVPLLAIDWMRGISSWAGKKGDENESQPIEGAGGKSAA